MDEKLIMVNDLPVEIVRKKNIKNLHVRVVPPNGDIVASSPLQLSNEEIRFFILKKMPEIIKLKDSMLAQERQKRREYVSGEACYLWGKPYMLQVVYEGNKSKIMKTPSKIIMTVPVDTSLEKREVLLTEWYRKELKRILEGAIVRCENKTSIHANEYLVKYMKTNWGTCNIEKRRIWINLQLVKKPIDCLDYILIHELVHLVEKNHTKRFQALIEEFCPTWREAKKLLTEMPLDYIECDEVGVNGEEIDDK